MLIGNFISTSQIFSRLRSINVLIYFGLAVLSFSMQMLEQKQFIIITSFLSIIFFLNLLIFEISKKNASSIIQLLLDTFTLIFILFISGGYQNPLSLIIILYFLLAPILLNKKELILFALSAFSALISLQITTYTLKYNNISFLTAFEFTLFFISLTVVLFSYWFTKNYKQLIKNNNKLLEFTNRLDKYKSLGLLTAGVCHELGTPLNTILLNLDDLETQIPSEEYESVQRNLNKCIDSLNKLNLQIHDQDNNFYEEHFFIGPTIKKFIEEKSNEFKIHIHFKNQIKDDVFKAPKIILLRSLYDLIQNAQDAKAQNISIELRKSKDFLILLIQDDGPGFNSDVLKNLGIPFLTTKRNGTGLALYHLKNFIQLIGGTIEAQNEYGAKIKILFPHKGVSL